MRHFTSYGPVDPQEHYGVSRDELVRHCVQQLVGNPDKGGHYFTIWAARQTGKTWLMRRAIEEIRRQHGDRFVVGAISMQDVVLKKDDPPEALLPWISKLFSWGMQVDVPAISRWDDLRDLLSTDKSPFRKPIILLIDEFDKLQPAVIDVLVNLFRGLYLSRATNRLHGLALIGVRATLGVDSERGSPFNVQRSLHVPNLTQDEVSEMFRQFQDERGQPVDPAVVTTLHNMVRGQPGLVGWFGELLTEKYNPRPPAPIDMACWHRVYAAACQVEPNNTLLNLLKKAKSPYLKEVIDIFNRTDVPFSFGQDWCNYLYLNGIIDFQETAGTGVQPLYVCRFSSPFVQQRLFSDLSGEITQQPSSLDVPVLEMMDELNDVFTPQGVMTVPLLSRYAAYLSRLVAAGEPPWRHQPLRKDLRPMEAVGHFHLYNWLCAAIGKTCLVSPEFPTGNGTVDLMLQWEGHKSLIEVKSFTNLRELKLGQQQVANYAERLQQQQATLAVFVPTSDPEILAKLSTPRQFGAITIDTVALSFGGHT